MVAMQLHDTFFMLCVTVLHLCFLACVLPAIALMHALVM